MNAYHFYHPIEVRYGDLDPQGHVNNASYLTYLEQARINYIRSLGLWDGGSFLDVGIILADAHLTFHNAIQFGQAVRVGVSVVRLGNKSLDVVYRIEDASSGLELATGSTVLVAYDYRRQRTIPIPQTWRERIMAFEEITEEI